jgi:SAM-dependent methyltransferase
MKLSTALKYLKPRFLRDNRRGTCTVCGRRTLFLLAGDIDTVRNHALCVRCGSCSRHRHLALWVIREFSGMGIRSLRDFADRPEIAVFNAGTEGAVAKALGQAPNIVLSEYFDDVEPGSTKGGIMCQDLQRLSFPDASIDLVLTEDVFEHLTDWRLGFRDVHRVLKPGGRHIFTVPFYFDRRTRDLFRLVDGKPVLFEPVEYHGDPVRGLIPCYTHIGYDALDYLREIGFETRIEISRLADQERHGTFDCYTLVTTKKP